MVIDHGRRVHFFESALSTNVVWVELAKVDLTKRRRPEST